MYITLSPSFNTTVDVRKSGILDPILQVLTLINNDK